MLPRPPFTVTATNATICSVYAANLNFGSTGILRAALPATSSITVTCTNAAPYTVALGGGLSGATNPAQRKMSQATETITYGLYQDSGRAAPWGDSVGVNTMAGTGIGAGADLHGLWPSAGAEYAVARHLFGHRRDDDQLLDMPIIAPGP